MFCILYMQFSEYFIVYLDVQQMQSIVVVFCLYRSYVNSFTQTDISGGHELVVVNESDSKQAILSIR